MKRLVLLSLLLVTACAPVAPRPIARPTGGPIAAPPTAAPADVSPVKPTAAAPPPSPSATVPPTAPPTVAPTAAASPAEPTLAECRRWLASSQQQETPIACADWAFFRPELFERGGGAFPLGEGRYYLVWFPENWDEIADRKVIVSLHGTGGCAEWMLNQWYQTTDHKWVLVAVQYYDPATKSYDDDAVIYDNLRTALAELEAHCPIAGSDIFYHGFSRGSAQSFPVAVRDRAGDRLFAAFIADSGCAGLNYPTLRDAPADALSAAHFWLWCGQNDVSTVDPGRTTCQVMAGEMRPYVESHGGVVDALIQEEGGGHGMFNDCSAGEHNCVSRKAGNLGPSLPLLFEYIAAFEGP